LASKDENMQQHNQRMGQEQAGDEVDRMLDAALMQYGSVEPREGLEDRVLAQLRSQSLNSPSRTWWRWGIGAAVVAALAMVLAVTWRPHPQSRDTVTQPSAVSTPRIDEHPALHEDRASEQRTAAQTRHRRLRVAPAAHVVNVYPKLDQFPSPQPLSEQEKLLASYVEVYPKQAAVLARLRTEELERERIEQRSKSPSKNAADFDKE
jgi:hypothetical protein